MDCIVCNKELSGRQKMYCSIKCKNINHKGYDKTGLYNKQYLKQKEIRLKLILQLGGKCTNCGYNKNMSALNFHHLDPSRKLFRIDARRCSNNKYSLLLEEANKCILLCANCHMELHYPDYKMVDLV